MVLKSVIEESFLLFEHENPDFDLILDLKEDVVVEIDKPLILQVFNNLIQNSLKYRDKNRKLQIHVYTNQVDGSIQISFQDNGIGFNQNNSKKIFLPFQRLHRDTSIPGTGIGLSICKKIIELHNGEIWADSVPGEGSTFHIKIKSTTYTQDHSKFGQTHDLEDVFQEEKTIEMI